jgi:carboxyl-terminal processing protease
MRRGRAVGVLVLVAVSAVLFFGAGERFLSSQVLAFGTSLTKDLELFSQILQRVDADYVEEVDPHKLMMASIDGMLDALDPHTQFLDDQQYGDLMVSTQGSFGGLGIVIAVRDGVLTVISPIEGTPAYQMGIQGGDRILFIDGETTEGMKSEDAVKRLRGAKGTKVTISISREGTEGLHDYTITRDIIELKSVPYAFLLPDHDRIGYIRVTQFMKSTSEDLEAAIEKLERENLKGLVVDLRRNPGGLLDQAVAVSELFLKKDELITFTMGRKRASNHKFYDRTEASHDGYPLIVLVNRESASASEIVAGAIQDWDRGLIVGTETFGKGSVQSVLPLSERTGLKITTAKYYTPSGRSIHKDEKPITVLKTPPADSLEKHAEYHTNSGRSVLGGGGITPDIVIDQERLSKLEEALARKSLFFEYAVTYLGRHKGAITESFDVSDAMSAEFQQLARSKGVEFTDEEFAEDRGYIDCWIRAEIFRKRFGDEAAYKTAIEMDGQLKAAVELFDKAQTLQQMFALAAEERAKNPPPPREKSDAPEGTASNDEDPE